MTASAAIANRKGDALAAGDRLGGGCGRVLTAERVVEPARIRQPRGVLLDHVVHHLPLRLQLVGPHVRAQRRRVLGER